MSEILKAINDDQGPGKALPQQQPTPNLTQVSQMVEDVAYSLAGHISTSYVVSILLIAKELDRLHELVANSTNTQN